MTSVVHREYQQPPPPVIRRTNRRAAEEIVASGQFLQFDLEQSPRRVSVDIPTIPMDDVDGDDATDVAPEVAVAPE